jgi:hypothetical protein
MAALLLASCGGGGGGGGGGGDDNPPAIDLVAELAAPRAVTPGETFDFEVSFRATGGAIEGIVPTLVLPDSVTIDVISDGGIAEGNSVTWPATDSLAAGGEVILAVSVVAPSIGPLDASLVIATATNESSTANNNATARTVLGFDPLVTLEAEASGDSFGFVADEIGDITGDGSPEYIVGAPLHDAGGLESGRAYVFSGTDPAPLYTVTGMAAAETIGYSVAAAGDVNGDGIGDFMAGGPSTGAGVVRVYSGADGALLLDLSGPSAGSRFGELVSGLGDVDGDGRSDILVSAIGGSGEVFVVNGQSGTAIRSHAGTAGARYGYGIGELGDVSGDGVPDYAIAGASGGGFVEARSGANGGLLYTVSGIASASQLGFIWIDAVGDVDGDSRPDFFAADINDGGNRGRAYLVSGATGATIRTFAGETGNELFGIGRHGGHDVDGDGINDIFAAGYHNGEGATNGGKGYVFSGATGELLRTMTSTIAGETLGYDAVLLGDVDGDGLVDYLLTGDLESGAVNDGRAYVIRGTPLP